MDTTHYLAKLIGLMFLIIGAFIIYRKDCVNKIVDDLHEHPSMIVVTGIINLLLGLLIVLSHNVWVLGWPVIITILGYLILIKGLLRLFACEYNKELTRCLLKGHGTLIWGIITVVIGAFLTYMGFMR